MEVNPLAKILRFVSYLRERASKQGFAHLPAFLYQRVKVELIERRYGIHTRGWIGSGTFTEDPNCFDYDPIDYETIQEAFSTLKLEDGKSVLLDYGCGKGRILAVAARYPFQRVLGIELSKYLCDLAEGNLKSMRLPKRCTSLQIINADARSYTVPSDVDVIFLFNPFAGEIMSAVVQKVEQSLAASPRAMTIFHIHFQRVDSPFAASKYFTKARNLSLLFREEMVFEVFESVR